MRTDATWRRVRNRRPVGALTGALIILAVLLPTVAGASTHVSRESHPSLGGVGALEGVAPTTTTTTSAGDPSTVGQFEEFDINGVSNDYYQPPSPAIAIHMVLLDTGDVLVIGPVNYRYPPYDATAYVWNPTPGAPDNGFVKEVDPPDEIYCSGIAELSDGTVVISGGRLHNLKFAGPPLTYTFDPVSMTWKKQPNIPYGRFYPTETELSDGSILSDSGGTVTGWYNNTLDILSPGTPNLRIQSTPPIMDFDQAYPHQWLMPDGNVLTYQYKTGFVINTSNPNPDDWTTSAIPNSTYEHVGNGPGTVLLPGGLSGPTKIIVMGGASGTGGNAATNNVEELDYSDLAAGWKTLAPIPGPGRNHANAVLLPDGTVFLAGGNSLGQWDEPQHQELLYNPSTNTWTGLASNDPTIQRGYHSNAVLLPTGQILIGGDTGGEVVDGKSIKDNGGRLEVYNPPYLFQGARPTITSAPSTVVWGSTFNVGSSSDVTSAVLMAPAAQTHSVDMNQRAIDLPLTTTATGETLTAPSQNVAPPGYYMLFLLNAVGVPSVASWVHLGSTAPVVTAVSVPAIDPYTGGQQVTITGSGFTNAVGVKFGVTGASFRVVSDTKITATSPIPISVGAGGAVDITVETATAQSAVNPGDVYSYTGPDVTGVSPNYGPETGGTTITISGSNFAAGDKVHVGGVIASNIVVISPNSITATVAGGSGLDSILVTTPSGESNPITQGVDQFNYEPSVTNATYAEDGPLAISPFAGPDSGGGSPVVVHGDNFDEATAVYFGNEPADSWKLISDTEIEAVPPPAPSFESYGDVTVRAPAGSSAPNALDNYCWYNPALGQTPGFCQNHESSQGD